ncbi:unnamed protein product, partial [Didymodactylos carnosus]
GFTGVVKFELNFPSGGAIDTAKCLVAVRQNFPSEPPSYQISVANLYEPPPPSYERAAVNNNFADTNMFVSPSQAPYPGLYERNQQFKPPEFIPQYPEPLPSHQPQQYPQQLPSAPPGNNYPPSQPNQPNYYPPSAAQNNYSNTQWSVPNQPDASGMYPNLNHNQSVQTAYQNNYNPNQIYVPQVQILFFVEMSRQITAKDIATLPQPGLNVAESFSFSPDDKFITYLRSPNDTLVRQLYTYNYTQNSEAIYVQPPDNRTGETEDNLSQEEKLRRERQRQLITGITRYSWAKKGYLMLIPIGSDLYIKDESQQLKLLIKCESNDKPILDPRLSRDGKTLAYVQDSELYVIATDGKTKAKQLTTDARYADKTNGLAEFIAQEEMDRFEGFWWSNDSKYIAYTQVDETNVPVYRIAHQGSDDPLQDEEHH